MTRLELHDRTVDLDTGRIAPHGELRAMELRVLRHLVSHAGEVVSITGLLTEVWGYASSTRTHTVHSTLHRLRVAIEADPSSPRHLVTVRGVGVRLDGVPPSPAAPELRGNLSRAVDSFLGRTDELAVLSAESGLFVLVGIGGAGKTRLAVEVAHRGRASYPGGVWFVDASGATGLRELTERVGMTVGVAPDEVTGWLGRAGPVLLVLDDLDPTAPGIAAGVATWCAAGAGTKLLVTATEGFAIAGARHVAVGPLASRPTGDAVDVPSVAMLIDRIRSTHAGFDPSEDPAALVELAHAVDGLPLGLEIVAWHAATVGPRQALQALLDQGSLADHRRDRPPRHASIEAMIAHTWGRLPTWVRAALAQLAVFHHSFTIALARGVLELPTGSPPAAEVVGELVERGLAAPVVERRSNRYRLFGTVRSHVRSRGADPAAEARYDRAFVEHAAWFREDGPFLPSLDVSQPELLELLHAGNRVLDAGVTGVSGVVPVLAYHLISAAGWTEVANTLEERLDRAALDPRSRARFGMRRIEHHLRAGDVERVARWLPGTSDAAAALGLVVCAAGFELNVARGLANPGRLREAQEALGRATRLRERAGPVSERIAALLEVEAQTAIGALAVGTSAAVDALERAVAVSEAAGLSVAVPRLNLATTAWWLGQYDLADRELRRVLADPSVTDFVRGRALERLASVERVRGRYPQALRLAEEAVVCTRAHGVVHHGSALTERAWIRLGLGDRAGAEADGRTVAALQDTRGGLTTDLRIRVLLAVLTAARSEADAIDKLKDIVAIALGAGVVVSARDAATHLVDLHFGAERWADGLRVLDPLDRVFGPWVPSEFQRSEALRRLGDRVGAGSALRRALSLGGGPGYRRALAALLAEDGHRAESDAELRHAPPPEDDWDRVFEARRRLASGDRSVDLGDLPTSDDPLQRLLGAAIRELRATG